MRLISLGSGSSGNGFVLDTGQVAVLVDCGVAARPVQAAIKDLGIAERLAGIVVSHEHTDHVRSVTSVLRRADCPVITTSGTYRALRFEPRLNRRSVGERFADANLEITFVGVSHDATDPCGFVAECDGQRIAVFTDLGYVTGDVLDALSSAEIIVLEANYDRAMLARGPYPQHLKRRIQSPTGHLSNEDCAAALVASVSSRTRAIWLAHLSHNNNTPDIARRTVVESLSLAGHDIPVSTLPRFERAEITAVASRQLAFGF